jgi:hypothetical protein
VKNLFFEPRTAARPSTVSQIVAAPGQTTTVTEETNEQELEGTILGVHQGFGFIRHPCPSKQRVISLAISYQQRLFCPAEKRSRKDFPN